MHTCKDGETCNEETDSCFVAGKYRLHIQHLSKLSLESLCGEVVERPPHKLRGSIPGWV